MMLRYLLRNSLIRIVSFGLGIVFALLVTPVVIQAIGQATYGLWALISATVANYLLFDFGLSQAVSKFVAEARGKDDQRLVDQICSSAIVLNVVSCLMSLVTTIVLIIFWNGQVPAGIERGQAIASFALYASLFSLLFLSRTWNGVLAAEMRWTLLAIIDMARNMFVSLTVLMWITGTNGLFLLSLVNSAGFLLEGLAYWFFAKKDFRVSISARNVKWPVCRQLLGFGMSSVVAQLGAAMRFRSQPYILIRGIGVEGVAVFSVAAQLVSYLVSMVNAAFGVFIPLFSHLQAKKDHLAIKTSMLNSLWLSFRVSSYVGLCLIFYGEDFIDLWLGTDFRDVRLALLPMALGGIFIAGMLPAAEFLLGVAQHRLSAICNLGEGISILISSILSASFFGLAGIGWSFFISSFMFKGILLPYFSFKKASISFYYYLKIIFILLIVHILPQYIFWMLAKNIFLSSYTTLILLAAFQFIIVIFIHYSLYLIHPKLIGLS